ncbi:MAG: DUF5012 domain-containing protein [Bacteroidales bacterium]|jgi:type II secretory pathway pseudopilin PulG|nr:DUF5012 domain-containing protein [Bacteroidales bacterium]MCI2134302.1 DUF5012 domain-containing protein [Bacteroidales bacterium]
MKKIFYIAFCALSAIAFGSCQNITTDGVTGITYYPVITLEGDSQIIVQKGTQYNEPGYSAVLNGEDVTASVEVITNLNTSKSGAYSVTYKCVNADGFSTTASRKVIVLDLNDAVEGLYLTSADSYRDRAGAITKYGSSFQILVTNNGDGTYSCDDILGGYYCQRQKYGTDYALAGTFSLDDSGKVKYISSFLSGWGDSASDMTGSFDAGTKTFNICTVYAGMNFYVTMTKE